MAAGHALRRARPSARDRPPRSTPRPTTPTAPLTLAALAATLRHRRVPWREGSRGQQASRFAAVRVHLAHRHAASAGPGREVWLLSEWPRGETAPTKYYLSSLPATTPLRTLVRFGKLRWRIERDYQELKGELGSITSRDVRGLAFITTSRYVPPPTRSSRAVGRFFPQSTPPWTLAAVRRHLQALLLTRLPRCPLSEVDARNRSARGPAPWPVRRGALGLAYAAVRHTGSLLHHSTSRRVNLSQPVTPNVGVVKEPTGSQKMSRFLSHQG